MTTTTKQSKLHLFFRKRVLSLKRNYYTLPFVLVSLCSFFFLCVLFIINKSVGRCDFKPTAVFLFAATLTSILSIVAFLGYSKKVYGQKRSLKMLIIYFVLIAICLGFTITVFYFNEQQIASEIAKRDAIIVDPKPSEWYTYQTYINYGVCSRILLIVFFVLELIANASIIFGPQIEKRLQKIHFDNVNENENKEE